MMTVRGTALFVMLLLPSAQLHHQNGFHDAHALFTQFWTDALSVNKSDTHRRDQVRADATALPARMQPALVRGIQEHLDDGYAANPGGLKELLSSALTAPMMQGQTAEGVADVISRGKHDEVFVAYAVNYCIVCSNAWLGEFEQRNGRYALQTDINLDSANQTVHLAMLPPQAAPTTILLYGTHLGDPHNRLDLRLYAAHKEGLHLIWSLLDQPEGEVTIRGSTVEVRSRKSMQPDSSMELRVFQVTGEQVVLKSQAAI